MSRLLKHHAKDDKWRLWTNMSDGWLTKWLTASEMKQHLAQELEYDYKVKVIERLWSFPHGYYNKEVSLSDGQPVQKMFNNWDAYQAFTEWHLKAIKSDDFYTEVDRKFKELTEEVA